MHKRKKLSFKTRNVLKKTKKTGIAQNGGTGDLPKNGIFPEKTGKLECLQHPTCVLQ